MMIKKLSEGVDGYAGAEEQALFAAYVWGEDSTIRRVRNQALTNK